MEANPTSGAPPGWHFYLPGRRGGDRKAQVAWFDRIVVAGIACLVIFSPLAIGSVNPWAFGTAEATIFLLTIVGLARLATEDGLRRFPGLRTILIPGGLFVALIIFQLLPLPPSVERVLSPSTYRLYATSLPGWPERDPYPHPLPRGSDHESAHLRGSSTGVMNGHIFPRWRPISIAPGLTGTAALKLIAYGCLFLLVLYYPLPRYPRPRGERRFYRRLLELVLIMGLVVACVGLLEQAYWNGAILWVYVPYDWGHPRPGFNPRASGPFVDPDHFAAYLNLILPLALAGGLFETFLSGRLFSLRLFFLATASVIVCAIALSLSRGGWIAGLLGASIVVWTAMRTRRAGQLGQGGKWLRVPPAVYVVVVLCIVTGAALYAAPHLPTAVEDRLKGTINEPDLASRLGYWRDTLPLIRDFPVLGVGLGCFQDAFPRYQSPPWSQTAVRQAHNDYVELAAEAGLAGVALLLWFGLAAGIRIYRGLKTVSSEVLPVAVALIAGLAAMAFQEFFDFALQIPANAVLFTIFLAFTLRLCRAVRGDGSENRYAASKVRLFAAVAGVAAVVLITAALGQDKTPYPYLSAPPHDARAALTFIVAHPARATPHIWYAALQQASPASQMREVAIAASLEPNNPLILDRYAQALAINGRTDSALAELTRSIFVDPSMADHFYLRPDLIPRLSVEERNAIDRGFRMAVTRGFSGADPALAAFYAAVHHDVAEAEALSHASSATDQPAHRAQLLLKAGAAYLRADEMVQAATAFRQAARIDPLNPEPYQYLATGIFAPRKDIDSAKAALKRGLEAGADPFALYLSLVQVYEQAGDLNEAESALLQASWSRPGGHLDYDTMIRLADMERRAKHFDRAALWMRQAIAIRPGLPDALYQLALVEEADYEYGQALSDLKRAMKFVPGNVAISNHYRELKRMIAAHSQHNHR